MVSHKPDGAPLGRKRSRGWLGIAALAAASMLLSSCGIFRTDPAGAEILEQSLPADWIMLTDNANVEGFQSVNIDGDEPGEWLLFFHYDGVGGASNGPIGGVIYDGQQDTSLYNPDTVIPIPLQPLAFFVPYRLLPDWMAGKGQGYLGETNVRWEQIPADAAAGSPAELVIVGEAPGGDKRLTLTRWAGPTQGYALSHFVGSYSVTMPDWEEGEGQRIDRVETLDVFADRSKLCRKTVWTRQGVSLAFSSTPQTISFCLGGVPDQPTYPEAVVLGWLLADRPDLAATPEVQTALRQLVPRTPDQVITLAFPGEADVTGTGNSTVSQMVVESQIVLDGALQTIRWRLREQLPPDGKTTRWRIESAEPG